MNEIDQLKLLLEQKESSRIQWYEPWIGVLSDGNPVIANLCMSASAQDCINLQREYRRLETNPPGLTASDEDLLADFMAVHWASPVPGTLKYENKTR